MLYRDRRRQSRLRRRRLLRRTPPPDHPPPTIPPLAPGQTPLRAELATTPHLDRREAARVGFTQKRFGRLRNDGLRACRLEGTVWAVRVEGRPGHIPAVNDLHPPGRLDANRPRLRRDRCWVRVRGALHRGGGAGGGGGGR